MVYLSELMPNPGDRYTSQLMADSYELYRYLMAAFPDTEADGVGRILYRMEMVRHEPRLLVQSESEPTWDRLSPLPSACRGPKSWEPVFSAGQTLRFRLHANATKNRNGKREPLLTRDAQAAWLERKGVQHGFAVIPSPAGNEWFDAFDDDLEPRVEVRIARTQPSVGYKPATEATQALRLTHHGVDFNGAVRVTDAEAFACAIASGIGPAKAFGFGLLSVARID